MITRLSKINKLNKQELKDRVKELELSVEKWRKYYFQQIKENKWGRSPQRRNKMDELKELVFKRVESIPTYSGMKGSSEIAKIVTALNNMEVGEVFLVPIEEMYPGLEKDGLIRKETIKKLTGKYATRIKYAAEKINVKKYRVAIRSAAQVYVQRLE